MEIERSYSLEFELRRFLSRCPKLAPVPQFSYLLKEGHSLTDKEVVNALAELFLHPYYTIPLMGCFRSIAQKIVERAVALLRLVPDLRSNSDGSTTEDEILREFENLDIGVGVIDFYIRSGRPLILHELACLAFCRALDLAPFTLGSVLSYFKFAPPPFERVMQKKYFSELSTGAGIQYLLNVIRASYRLLLAQPEVFSTLWDWSCFWNLVQQSADFDPGDNAELLKNVSDMRWCGIQILSVVLKISDRATANFGLGVEEAFTCLLRWQEFCEDVSLEKAGWYLESFVHEKSGFVEGSVFQTFAPASLVNSSKFHEIEPSNGNKRNVTSTQKPFVLTSSMKKSFEMVRLAVSQKWPVLLYGPCGVGKTKLISELAWESGSQVLSIHMDEQIDGKTLIGSYVCTEKPGEFRWQPGSLTQAVLNGFWVVFEDIDKAPSDVQSILLPLLEGASSFLTGHGEAIRVAEGFRLFSTISSSKLDASHAKGHNTLGATWRRVMIGSPSNDDLISIVKARYPDLESLAGKLVETFERINQLARFQFGTPAFSSPGRFSLRDLLKWCKRIAALGFSFSGDGMPTYICERIYQEAVDIFASFTTLADNRLTIMKYIAKMWAAPISAAETLYPVNKPVIQELRSDLRIGRITLQRTQTLFHYERKPFVEIRSSTHVLEKIASSVKFNEPVLLVGETGTGKTTLVQSLALRLGQKLTVLNLSQQSDIADLLGGFKPMNAQFVCIPLYREFENLFTNTFSLKDNEGFLVRLKNYVNNKNWKMLLSGFQKGVQKIIEIGRCGSGTKRKRPLGEELLKAWEDFSLKVETASAQINDLSGMIFSFVEGAFVTALRNGEWILLDEVNLAPPETLQRVIGVLEEENSSLCLAERGDVDYIHRHPSFRIFACMNPATDAGKRDLPYLLRSRFTEYFVDDVLDDEDLILFINQFMDDGHSNVELVKKIVNFYKVAKKESEERLQDGANQKPQYSLRSLYRALEYTKKARRKFGFQKALHDGFCMFFLTLLDGPSAKLMNQMISSLLGGNVPAHVPFDGYLMVSGNSRLDNLLENYVLTKSVKEHLRNLARAIFVGRYPVLLQGPTSSGKTSLVQYLAAITGHEFVRINNHEHTDLQEYLGSYITDACGRLVFHEGVLVKAVRNGYWIVLDELNLAPSDVLEALNRLLDDNRELFVPELRETVRAHPDFMLFATQNPPTFYGGRKMLSRAFRNRFVEIHVDEIPRAELSIILKDRCKISETYAKKMVDEVMKDLQLHRQSSKVFAGKHGFITPRDLFRWAGRFRTFGSSYEDLAREGYFLLAERLRDEGEKTVVQEVLERQLRVKLARGNLYNQDSAGRGKFLNQWKLSGVPQNLGKIVWTESMWRLYFLIERCYKMREPVVLVGETGGGKTTVCQLLSIVLGSKLHILNCHQYTETSDFLGGFYPVRERSRIALEFKNLCEQLMLLKAFVHFPGAAKITADICQASSTIDQLAAVINSYRRGLVSHPDVTIQDLDSIEQLNLDLVQLHHKWQTIFMWQDGPLVEAMKNGDLFLVDEISLADDSVLERLNSVLEPERKLSLAEKGGSDLDKITAHPNFFLLATMNPGGDYGKKELSPALRNRFTEIWVPPVNDVNELRTIALQRITNPDLSCIVDPMLNFWEWFNQLQTWRTLTVRDLLSWIDFINATEETLQPDDAFLHGVFLVLLDGLSLGTGISKSDAGELRERCLSFLLKQLKMANYGLGNSNLPRMENYSWGDLGISADISCGDNMQCDNFFGIPPFYIAKGDNPFEIEQFEFLAPTTRRNAFRVLRALQLPKPVLLEGSPGVGKTSLIVALGKFSGHSVVRINLSEQTDMMDLLGSDLPVEGDEGMQFAWHDGILLQALKKGSWVLLDELNLAPQSVLEGLNAILDHRAEVFIPELGVTFKCPSSFRVFACQNPSCQGGGRKGLPKSLLNRFTKVYVDELTEDDYLYICSSLYPSIPKSLLSKLILFNKRLHEDTVLHHKFAQEGSPWEFNLRDVIRSCQIIQGASEKSKIDCFLSAIYVQRMRTAADRRKVVQLYEEVFGLEPLLSPYPRVQLNPEYLVVGNSCIKRNHFQSSKTSNCEVKILPGIRHSLEAASLCVQHEWLCILVGQSSSGKTSLIRLLAQLTGNILNELNLSSATEISELLGCFEQYNAFRHYHYAITRIECYISEYCSLQPESSTKEFIKRRKDLTTQWLAFLSSIGCGPTTSPTSYTDNWRSRNFGSVPLLVEIIEYLKLDLEANRLPVSWSSKDLDRTLKTIVKMHKEYHKRPDSAKFEWVTGVLVKAIENGEWIVLENANLCNPTVLDRINSLVEPHGSITINECGSVDGKPLVLHPHPQFRMFLTVDPSYGEVSRAMRNRGVEIYVMQPYWMLDGGNGESLDESELKDVKRFLILAGIPIGTMVDLMAKAHIYARFEGLRLDVKITYLELARWVQLFQRLLTNGNRPVWSLQISFEHTYLSTLGEAEGKDIVSHAIISAISLAEYKFETSPGYSLCLPGGWPTPLKVRDYIWYSKEASVKQNCLYLEFLGAQIASYKFRSAWDRSPVEEALRAAGSMGPYLMDMKILHVLMYPNFAHESTAQYGGQTEIDLVLAGKKLVFAANWAIEQATENDLELYLLWFSWFNSRLLPFCNFFSSFLNLLKEELKHPIWNCILRCRHELLSQQQVNLDSRPIPILSMELDDSLASNDVPKSSCELLCKAINCAGLLRASFQQWHVESEYVYSDKNHCFIPILRSLRRIEEKVLDIMVESPSFDVVFQLYTDLLEDHISFWKGIISSQFEMSLLSWRSLTKNATKLQIFCPKEVDDLQKESKNLARVSSWCLHSQGSLLWVYGGHPFLPSSADLYQKQHQLLNLCKLLWPRNTNLWRQAVNEGLIEAAVSANPELRFLAMRGVGMSSYVMANAHDDELHAVQELEEMYQMLLKRFQSENEKLEAFIRITKHANHVASLAACCVFSPDILCRSSGFDSWQETLPIIDNTSFFLDMELLQKLSQVVLVDAEELQSALCNLSDLLESTLNFSLNFSSRPLTDFLPHQKILWTLDAWTSIDAENAKIASFVLEMWSSWHSSLWTTQPVLVKNFLSMDGFEIPLPQMLLYPVRVASVDHILHNTCAIKDYPMHCLKIRVASCNLWQSFPLVTNVHSFLLCTARSLLLQIIYAHRKSFEAEKYTAIKSILCSFQEHMITHDKIKFVLSLLASSSHFGFASLVDSFIKPLLEELYLQCSSTDLYNLGRAWLRVGGLRYKLLITFTDLDPAMKYSCKHLKLLEKIALFGLENEVRKESTYLAGQLPWGEADKQRTKILEKLQTESKRIKRKIVFRSDPGKFAKLKYECDDFFKLVEYVVDLIKDVDSMDIQQISNQLCNWQETATRFIDQLSNEYSAYVDIIQPVQVAIYEMKLGLSMVLSSALQKKFLVKVGQHDMDRVLDTIYTVMRFPRSLASEAVSVKINCGLAKFSSCDIDFPMNSREMDMNLLQILIISTRDVNTDKMVSDLQLKVAIRHMILVRVAHSIADAQLMDNASFSLLDKIFDEFASIWMNMKVKVKIKQDYDAQQFKFKPRAFKIENIIEIDVSTLVGSLANETLSEWQELLSEEVTEKKVEEEDDILEEWTFMEDSNLNNMVHVHNQLFGSMDLVQTLGILKVSEEERLSSFIESYTLGVRMIRGLEGLLSSGLDSKLVPEHLFRLCLEHEQKFSFSRKSAHAYNFYKDSNAPMMAQMVDGVSILQERIVSLLKEQDDNPALQKILDVIEMILAIPLSTPLAKALSGLQFLLNRIRMLQEAVSKIPFSDELRPISLLVSSWQKLEFESWPALLDDVQIQFEINAGKLWFPLYSVLHHRHSADIPEYDRSTIQSLEEFIQTSTIGEFRKRLELLFAFHGQISSGIYRGSYLSLYHMENVKILYNIFGFYVQYFPIILDHIVDKRKGIERELKELSKLCRWELTESYVSIENSKRTRQKLKKIIQKYTDLLQQPIMLVINQKAHQREIKTLSVLQGPKLLADSFDKNREILNVACDQTSFRNDRSIWYIDWRKKVSCALQNLDLDRKPAFEFSNLSFKNAEAVKSIFRQCIASQSTCIAYREESKQVWYTIENICRTAIDCTDIWKEEKKSLGKRRALADLLKLLDSFGLSKHRSIAFEDKFESNQSNWWLLQPSYDLKHLLMTQDGLPSNDSFAALFQLPSLPLESLDREWGTANQYYFKSVASYHLLRHICLNFHKDFTLEQVNRSISFLDHLIIIQQEQRAAAYGFSNHLRRLRKCASLCENLFSSTLAFDNVTSSECSFSPNQHVTFNCMWQQKHLFDGMCSMLLEECLLLKTVESSHLTTCQSVKAAANRVRIFLEKFVPDFQKSKDLLDNYLIGGDRVVTSVELSLHPSVVSKEMDQLVFQNFQMTKEFEEQLCAFLRKDEERRSVKEILLGRFEDILKKANLMAEDYSCAVQSRSEDEDSSCDTEKTSELEAGFSEALKETYKLIVDAFHKIDSWNSDHIVSVESLGNITVWKILFESYIENLQLDVIFDALVKAINCAEKLVNHCGKGNTHPHVLVGEHLKHLYSLLDLILTFSYNLLRDFLVVHRMVSMITHVLANIFASLYSTGFGVGNEDPLDESCLDKTQDVKGTGMGEGAGVNDVSDQITDEDQLLGTNEKLNNEQDDSNEVPSKTDKGIEMEQDFDADTFSVSEESGEDDNEDNQDEQLESAMGETGADSEIVDEKLWNKDDEENPNQTKEKYESGPSVKEADSCGRELRAKEDSDSATPTDEAGELSPNEFDKQDDEDYNQDGLDDAENMENMSMNNEEAFADHTGLKIDEPNQGAEDVEMNELEDADTMDDSGPEELDEPDETKNCEEENNSMDECHEELDAKQPGGNADKDGEGNSDEEPTEMDLEAPKKDVFKPASSDMTSGHVPTAESATQPKGDSNAADLRDVAQQAVEAKWSGSSDIQNDLAPMEGLGNASEIEITVPGSSKSGRISDDQPQSQLPQHDSSSSKKIQPNPSRNVGDALNEWKERVKVTVDLQDNVVEAPEDMLNENADEYGYTSEHDKGKAQALGPATSEQLDKNIIGDKHDEDGTTMDREDLAEEEVAKQDTDMPHVRTLASDFIEKIEVQAEIQNLQEPPEKTQEIHNHNEINQSLSESLVSLKRSYMTEEIDQLGKLSLQGRKLEKSYSVEETPGNVTDNATVLWKRYELCTTRLSQELAEQLRLVMEPTLASKLQGDYKNGKRINMKKVIPYIASLYRKDKIWMRRTRPNKRDYQVVVAVDDSRSMSESNCGGVAIEALVTVCRAMSQLEVGNLAVASFGKEGNIRLLHEFDRPFNGEAGVKMISSLTFKQENTIADEPVVDLLKYVNNMLDVAVAKTQLPSGQNPLQQLVLIIADGRFHEKEKLKRRVRDILNAKRMVAFLLLDNPQESIMDLEEVSFQGKEIQTSKYLDSFPFPYYVILRNIEALPRTLADLLRQWFELMQYSRD